MAKKTVTISVEEETLRKVDDFAENLGLSRSAACSMFITTAVTQDYKAFLSTVSDAVISKNERDRRVVETATA